MISYAASARNETDSKHFLPKTAPPFRLFASTRGCAVLCRLHLLCERRKEANRLKTIRTRRKSRYRVSRTVHEVWGYATTVDNIIRALQLNGPSA